MIKGQNKFPYLLLIPSMIIMIGLVIVPIIVTFFFSLERYKLTEPNNRAFVGIENYIEVLQSEGFRYSLVNTLFIVIVVIIISLICSITVALILNKKVKLNGVLTAIAILPWALSPIVNGIVWRFIFYPGFGFMNKFLVYFGVISEPITYTINRFMLMFIIALIVSWRIIPFCAIIFLSNMQSILEPLYISSKIDGANKVQTFFKITLPLLIPSFIVVITNITISAMNVFDEVIALSGYSDLGQTLLVYNYVNTFKFLNFGLGSAITYIIMLISGIAGYFYIKNIYNPIGVRR
ncbi:MAG: sugar ABC transporter permease [Clostridium sp.]|uniref:carbohydrate ABC transporter permease n=1 Tax=Clostridium sp. TaxID=1506 RepID=UPI002A851ABF|nr:sugar ABC transporter permease [Clostridium sp.]MDY5096980.1 sugar ABC transporter permease [Clostridium sp.]